MIENSTSGKNNHFYNPEQKTEFIQDMINTGSITEITSKSYERILSLVSPFEEKLKKDVYNFSFKELEQVLYGYNANNRNTVESYARIMSSYLNWCISKNYSKENPLLVLRPNDFIKYLTNNEEYFTEKELRHIEGKLENYQDAVILRLLFLGVGGRQLSEIRNLKKEDINRETKQIKLTNTLQEDPETGLPTKSTQRYIEVEEDYVFDLIEGASKATKYVKRNGEVGDGNNSRSVGELDLVINNYIVRSSITRTENFKYPTDKFVIYRRISMIEDVFGMSNLTTKLIQRCGMLYYAKLLNGNSKTIQLDDLKIIADRFNMASYHNLKGFLTVENIERTYDKQYQY